MQRRLSEFFTADLAVRAGFEPRGAGAADPIVTGIAYDSRRVEKGFAYFALPGLHADGHSFIAQAVAKGASVVVHQAPLASAEPGAVYLKAADSRFAMSAFSDAFYGSPSRDLAVVGVTGTEGKSTTVYLIYQLLDLSGRKAGFVSTVQYRTGEKEEWNPEHQTTPEAPTVHAALAAMRDSGMEFAVVESSSHGLSPRTNRLGDVAFDAGVMTNVTHEHLEFHGTWEQYRGDKANLFRALDAQDHRKARGVLADGLVRAFGAANADDPSAAYFAAATAKTVYTFSAKGAEADLSAFGAESRAGGNRYKVKLSARLGGGVVAVEDFLPGAFNVGNVLAALLVASRPLDKSVAELAPLAAKLRPVRGRMSVVDRGQDFEVLVDYAHTPSSFEAVLPGIKERVHAAGGRVISLFGSGGERDRQKRPQQGRIAADNSDIVVLADEDPRGEDPMELLEEIAAGRPELERGKRLFLIPDRPAAIRKAYDLARPGDAVLLLGKGHENSIIYKDGAIPYDEIAEAEKALAERGFGAKK